MQRFLETWRRDDPIYTPLDCMMTPESQSSNDVLLDVLQVLQRIEAKLEKQEQRVRSLEKNSKEKPEHVYPAENTDHSTRARLHSERANNTDLSLSSAVPYSIWHLGHPKPHQILDLEVLKVVAGQVEDYWKIPDDCRLPLKSFKIIAGGEEDGGSQPTSNFRTKRQIEKDAREIRQFDDALRIHPGNDFLVVDIDSKNDARLYRVGAKATGNQLRVEFGHSQHAPWSRIM